MAPGYSMRRWRGMGEPFTQLRTKSSHCYSLTPLQFACRAPDIEQTVRKCQDAGLAPPLRFWPTLHW
jgi:hypothetical protein